MVSSLELAPLGKSDHGILSFQLHCYINVCAENKIMRNYNKGDYDELRNQVALDWDSLLKPLDGDAEEQFRLFSDILEKAVEFVSQAIIIHWKIDNAEHQWIRLIAN